MSLWAIVPVKPLRRGKSRLAGVLSEDERSQLNHTMLENTLKALKHTPDVEQMLVVSRDPAALSLGRDYGARTLQEDGNTELNIALTRATVVAQTYASHSVLILPADLPLLTSDAITRFIRLAGAQPQIVIAPDRKGEGTNALLVSPAGVINYSYGPGSFYRHIKQAQAYNIDVQIGRFPEFELDIDVPEDFLYLQEIESNMQK